MVSFYIRITCPSFSSCPQAIGLAVGATVVDLQTAIVVALVMVLTFMVLGGYITQNLPFWLAWAKVVSFITYLYEAQLQLEFSSDQQFRSVQCFNIINL